MASAPRALVPAGVPAHWLVAARLSAYIREVYGATSFRLTVNEDVQEAEPATWWAITLHLGERVNRCFATRRRAAADPDGLADFMLDAALTSQGGVGFWQ